MDIFRIYLLYKLLCVFEKTKINKKRPGLAHLKNVYDIGSWVKLILNLISDADVNPTRCRLSTDAGSSTWTGGPSSRTLRGFGHHDLSTWVATAELRSASGFKAPTTLSTTGKWVITIEGYIYSFRISVVDKASIFSVTRRLNKRVPIFIKFAPKELKQITKSCSIFGLILQKNMSPKRFKSSPIWSH